MPVISPGDRVKSEALVAPVLFDLGNCRLNLRRELLGPFAKRRT
jgi:hypothetical protein